jgi:excisionase family DNA binding protein
MSCTHTAALGRSNEQAIPLTVAAKHLPLSEFKLRELVREGTIPATRVGRVWFIFPSDIRNSPVGALWRAS